MTLEEYYLAAIRTSNFPYSGEDALTLSALGLCGESGEFADLIKKHLFHAHPLNKEKLFNELGDVLWYVARAAQALNVTLDEIAERNISKLQKRYPQGFDPQRSINREEK